jgi:hypothetical protein
MWDWSDRCFSGGFSGEFTSGQFSRHELRAVGFENGRNEEVRLELLAVFPQPLAFVLESTFARGDLQFLLRPV